MAIPEQLAIVAQDAHREFLRLLTCASLSALAAIAAGLAVAFWFKRMTPLARWMRRHRLETLWICPFVLCMVYVGATKETPGRVSFPYTDLESRYLYDTGSYVTNDAVHVSWTRSAIVPATADFCGAYRPVGSTNDEDWVVFIETDFNHISSPTNIPFSGAMTNDFQFFTTYTPGPTVHTNGVAVIMWQKNYADGTTEILIYRTGVYRDGFRVAPNANITNGPPIEATLTTTAAPNAAESEEE